MYFFLSYLQDSGDKYSAFRELEQPSESKYGGKQDGALGVVLMFL